MIITRSLAVIWMVLVAGLTLALATDESLPPGFVYLRDVDPSIRQDIRYAGAHNFVGRKIAGYDGAECVLTARAAQALAKVQATLAPRSYALIVWDCYRPARAVAEFLRWTREGDAAMKAEFYPQLDKTRLVGLGYIAARSTHSGGSTVDLGLVALGDAPAPPWRSGALAACTAPKGERFEDGTIDLGTGFDCFDPRSRFGHPGIASPARENRAVLRDVMVRHGFKPYDREWWHFRLADPPFPGRAFDFPIPPSRHSP